MKRRNAGWNRLSGLLLGVAVLSLAACNDDSTEVVPGARAGASETANHAFVDVSRAAGIGDFRHLTGAFGEKWFPEAMGAGGGFIDYNNNGLLDILLVSGGYFEGHEESELPALRLYRNNGDGTFTEQTVEAGLGNLRAYGLGIAVADYDNSGWQDIYVTTLGRDFLLKNEGGVFQDVADEAGVADVSDWTTSAIFFDAENNGHLDLYVGAYVDWSPETDIWCTLDGETKGYCTPELYRGLPGRFYRNNGDGTFTNATIEAGFTNNPGKTLGLAEYDFNGNGFPDIFVANDTQRDLLYVNNGDGTFTERGAISGIAYDENGRARAGMGIDVGIVDDSGMPTMVVTNFSKEMIGVYRYMGNGLFEDRAAASRIGRPSLLTLGFGLFLFDADLNGYMDFFVTNGHVQTEVEEIQDGIGYRQVPHLFINQGDGTFMDIAPELGGVMRQPIVGRGAAYGDVNGNGRLDILVTENDGGAHLWLNNLNPDGNYFRIQLEGVHSNRDGIGARVVAHVGDSQIERRVRTGSSFLSASEKTLTFGLADADRLDSLIVYWPGRSVERFTDVPGNREVRLVEGSGELLPSLRESGLQLAADNMDAR